MNANDDSILIDGNTATALGCLYAGATVAGWYPITPATAVMDNFTQLCATYRREKVESDDPDAPATYKNNYLIIQAEDEIASIGMVLGAGWSGARAFTSTSGPGISLMSELLGLGYYTEIPAVIIDVQRVGPSTGMPTRTQQGDILMCAYASHGDTKHILLFPANPHECFEFAAQCFDLAERFQTPVFMLSDLDIGMNDWVVPKLTWDDNYVPDRGRVLDDEDLAEIAEFFRYTNEDDEFVTPRTLPGSDSKGAYFIRGSGHDKYGRYTEIPDQYQEVIDRLKLKHASAAPHVPAPLIERRDGAKVGVITVGSCDLAVREAIGRSRRPRRRGRLLAGARLSVRRRDVASFVEAHERCFVVEQNRDAPAAQPHRHRNGRRPRANELGTRLRRIPSQRAASRQQRAHPDGDCLMPSIVKPLIPLNPLPKNDLGLTVRDYEGAMSTLVCRVRSRLGHRGHLPRVLRTLDSAQSHRKVERHRVLVEDADVLRRGCARLQQRPRPHGDHRHGRQRRQPRAHLHRHLGRRRLALDRSRTPHARDSSQHQHGVRHREQRRLRTHQGPTLGLGRHRLGAEEGRRQSARAHRPDHARTHSRRDVSRAELLGRQGTVDPNPEGRRRASRLRADRRHLAVCHFQRPRRIDQELQVRARARSQGSARRTSCRCAVPIREKIPSDEAKAVTMHDGSVLRFRSVPEGYDPSDRMSVEEYIRDRQSRGEIATGMLYVNESSVGAARTQSHARTLTRERALRQTLSRQRRTRAIAG